MPRNQRVLASTSLLLLFAGAFLFVGCSDDNPVEVGPGTNFSNTVVIHTDPDDLNVAWSLAAPGGATIASQGDATLENMAAGEYTISWLPRDGWITPRPNPVTLSLGSVKQIDFSGFYFPEPGSVFINVIPGNLQAEWTLLGGEVNSSTGEFEPTEGMEWNGAGDTTLQALEPGIYEIIWQPVDGWYNPDQEGDQQGEPLTVRFTMTIFGFSAAREYRQSPGSVYIDPRPGSLDASWTLTGNGRLTATGPIEQIIEYTGTGPTLIADAWPDTVGDGVSSFDYTIVWDEVSGYTTPASADYEMSRGITLNVAGEYAQVPGSATIDAEPNSLDAPWTLVGPDGIQRSGLGDLSLSDLAPGDYTLMWGEVVAWKAPQNETLTVDHGGNVVFAGTYAPSLVLDPQPAGFSAPWQIAGPGGFSLSGTGSSVFNDLDAGSYTVTWNEVSGWTAPAAETVTLGATGIVVTGDYQQNAMTLFVRPEPAGLGAPWTITGPNGFSESGTGQGTVEVTDPGVYTLAWETLVGWTPPGPTLAPLAAGETITFQARYLETFDMVPVSAGAFVMGTRNESCSSPDETEHDVELTNDILVQATEVSNGTFAQVLTWAVDHGYARYENGKIYDTLDNSTIMLMNMQDPGLKIRYENGAFVSDRENDPVVEISWYAAAAYCDWLSLHGGMTRAYDHLNWLCNGYDPYNAVGYRLPTEAEWEYACRAGSETAYANTDIDDFREDCFVEDPELLDSICWFSENSQSQAHEVASKGPNAWGLFDMHGNVLEWCNDRYRSNYCGTNCPEENPVGPSQGDTRVQRGGYFYSDFTKVRSGARSESNPTNASAVCGFRVVITDR